MSSNSESKENSSNAFLLRGFEIIPECLSQAEVARFIQLTSDEIAHQAASGGETICEVPAGGAVLMRPMLLHASSPMERPGHRRVIHLEFAAFELPLPLKWRFRIPCN